MAQHFTVIGLSDSREQYFQPEILEIIRNGKIFSGGKRQKEIVSALLPETAEWISIGIPLENVFLQYAGRDGIIIFASGDPLFYGFANTLKNRLPEAEIKVYPSFSSIQTLAHRLTLPYNDLQTVSLTGRPWDRFDTAILSGAPLLGVLTDRKNTPKKIAERLLEYGYDNYRMHIGSHLGHEELEKIRTAPLSEIATGEETEFPNCLLLERITIRRKPFGIPEEDFELLDGRSRMITKMPVRLTTLSQLDLSTRTSLWDIGFCTGSVSIEARLRFPHLKVTAFEIRPEGERLMKVNSRRFGAPGIEVHIGDFLEEDLAQCTPPDAVFIGGYNGRLPEVMEKVCHHLKKDGVIVMNSVTPESRSAFISAAQREGRSLTGSIRLKVDGHNTIDILKAQ